MSDFLKVLFTIALVLGLAWLIADIAGGTTEQHLAVIVGRTSSPAHTTVAVGTDERGRPVTTVHTSAEAWYLVVRDDRGVHQVAVGVDAWAAARDDMVVPVCSRMGRWSGIHWSERVDGWPRAAVAEAP